jgi:hypothetical protein
MATHHAAQQDAGRVPTAAAHATAWSARHIGWAVAWILTPHDDRIPSLIQHALWFAAFVVLFVVADQP